MKCFIYSFLLLILSIFPFRAPAGNLGFYSDYNTLLKMEKQELRVSKLLDMLDKYPEQADELHAIFFETVYRFTFTPDLIRRAETIRKNIGKTYCSMPCSGKYFLLKQNTFRKSNICC